MKLLLKIEDKDIGIEDIECPIYRSRKAARAVIIHDGKIALLYSTKHNYYKLIGGGCNEKESISDCLKRECLEEAGAKIIIEDEIGKVIEYRKKFRLKQITYAYTAKAIKLVTNNLEQDEKEAGLELVWMEKEHVLYKYKSSSTSDYEGKFIYRRDLTILESYFNIKIN